jgi:hypothetical protein
MFSSLWVSVDSMKHFLKCGWICRDRNCDMTWCHQRDTVCLHELLSEGLLSVCVNYCPLWSYKVMQTEFQIQIWGWRSETRIPFPQNTAEKGWTPYWLNLIGPDWFMLLCAGGLLAWWTCWLNILPHQRELRSRKCCTTIQDLTWVQSHVF